MDEVDVEAVDYGRVLRERIQPLGKATEVVLGRPVLGERLQRRQLDALRGVVGELLGGPARRLDPPAQILDLLLWYLDLEGPDLGGGLGGGAHNYLPFRSGRNAARSSFVKISRSCQAAKGLPPSTSLKKMRLG